MIYFKGCPRCNGDLREDSDTFGRYLACLQCGYYLTNAEDVILLYSHSHGHLALSTNAASLPNVVPPSRPASTSA